MRIKLKIISLLIILLIILTGCKDKESEQEVIKDQPDTIPIVDIEPVPEVEEEEPKPKEGLPSPLSGLYADEDIINRRVVAIMLDNHPKARWQAGLKDAEIIYEFQVEPPYTRYLALYLINDPESIGAIRSARPYFITKVLEYDAVYVRNGGSEEAKNLAKSLGIADIDGLSSSNKVFWRNNNKKMPHNLYTSMDAIRKTQEERGYRMEGEYSAFKFNEEDLNILGYKANNIMINYFKDNNTEYNYNIEKKLYTRKKDGKDHIEETDDTQITAKNIIIQEVYTKVIDNEGRLKIDLIGEGKGKYFTNGIGIDINWVKNNSEGKTLYYNELGEEIVLNPGNTWIQMVNPKTEIIID